MNMEGRQVAARIALLATLREQEQLARDALLCKIARNSAQRNVKLALSTGIITPGVAGGYLAWIDTWTEHSRNKIDEF